MRSREVVGRGTVRTDDRIAQDTESTRAHRRRRRSRGQALVEFALVVPLFFLMLFGFVEIALVTASISSFNFATKDAARLGSLLGPTDSTVDTQIVNLIKGRVAGIVVAKTVRIEIYLSDPAADYILPGNTQPVENAYDGNGNLIGTAGWPVGSRNDTLLDADYLGVRVTYNYTYLTSYLSGGASTLQLIANSVQRIEPQDFQSRHVAPLPVGLALTTTSAAGRPGFAGAGDSSGLIGVAQAPMADVRRTWWGGAA
jgi:Flp pilus assembly protein TadG